MLIAYISSIGQGDLEKSFCLLVPTVSIILSKAQGQIIIHLSWNIVYATAPGVVLHESLSPGGNHMSACGTVVVSYNRINIACKHLL